MTDDELDRRHLARATRFEYPEIEPDRRGPSDLIRVAIENRRAPGIEDRWCIIDGSVVWTRNGEWEWEPQPSSRDEAFFKRARWTLAEARAEIERVWGVR